MSLLGLDVGTSRCKAVAFSDDGRPLAHTKAPLRQTYPRPGWAEMDPRQVWAAVKDVLTQASTAATAAGDPVEAIGLSVPGEAVTPVGSDGEPLCNSITAVDRRALPQSQALEAHLGRAHLFELTGLPPHPSFTINKLIWWRQEQPDIFQAAWKFLLYEDYLAYHLSASPVISHSLASRTMLMELRSQRWAPELLEAAGIEPDQLGLLRPSGTVAGEVPPALAKGLGLPCGVHVVSGGHDQTCCVLGAGAIHPGQAVDTSGTTECLTLPLDHPVTSLGMLAAHHPCFCHVVPHLYVTTAFTYTGGAILRWFRDTFGSEEMRQAAETGQDAYDLILSQAAKRDGHLLLLPHFAGSGTPHGDPLSKGAILGLTLGTTRADIVRAIVEAVCFDLRQNLESLQSLGFDIQEMRATGGGARSPFWLQLKADITGVPVISLRHQESGCLGAAILAGLEIGRFRSVEEAVAALIHLGVTYEPDPARHRQYEERYGLYREIYSRLADIHHRL